MRKPKILFVTESSFLATGYGTYTKELLNRLHKTGKYELAEYACYASVSDPRQSTLPWKYYGNEPPRHPDSSPINPQEQQQFDADPLNQLGKFRFEAVCLDFQPDIVADFRDEWYFNYQGNSPYRDYFYWVIQPAVDSEPQKESWLETFSKADAVLTYQRWSYDVLKKIDSQGLLKLKGFASPGVDSDIFCPTDKKAVRNWWGLPQDAFIVGMASRAQPRKMYPELIEAYSKYFYKLSRHEQSKNFLHLHTFYPDLCWDFPRYLKRHGLVHKVLFTYYCYQCEHPYITLFQDSRAVCKNCGKFSVMMPNTRKGLTRDQLANVYQTWDLAVQYSNSEGLGITQIEEAACGIPVASVDYSGMADVINRLEGYAIKTKLKIVDPNNGDSYRAIPDPDDLIEIINKVRNLPSDYYSKKAAKFRELAQKEFNWDSCAAKWMEVFDEFKLRDINTTWKSPPKLYEPQTQIPQEVLTRADWFTRWCIQNVLCDSSKIGTLHEQMIVHDLISAKVSPQVIFNTFINARNFANSCEQARHNKNNENSLHSPI